MYPAKFEYIPASSVNEAVALLGQHKDAKLIAGGHSLLPLMKLRLANPAVLVDIGRVKELRGIREDGGALAIGALTTHNEIANSTLLQDKCPILREAANMIGDLQVRNRGTIGGSLSHADPAADLPAVMLALGAQMVVTGPKGSRAINADDFFTGLFQTALANHEVLTEVRVPVMASHWAGAYVKHPHPASRFAVVGVAAVGMAKDGKADMVRLGITGASTHAYRPMMTEMMVNGRTLDSDTIMGAAQKAADGVEMNSDLVASATYRAHLVVVYTQRALKMLRSRLM